MPTFWRGFWPYAGGPNPVSSQQGQGKYKRCLNWNGRPRCSLSSIQDIIKKHPSSKFDLRRPGFTRRTYVNPMITGNNYSLYSRWGAGHFNTTYPGGKIFYRRLPCRWAHHADGHNYVIRHLPYYDSYD